MGCCESAADSGEEDGLLAAVKESAAPTPRTARRTHNKHDWKEERERNWRERDKDFTKRVEGERRREGGREEEEEKRGGTKRGEGGEREGEEGEREGDGFERLSDVSLIGKSVEREGEGEEENDREPREERRDMKRPKTKEEKEEEEEERRRRETARQKRGELIHARTKQSIDAAEAEEERIRKSQEEERQKHRERNHSHTHTFSEYTFKRPTYCRFCLGFIFGVYRQGCVCDVCSLPAHDTCASLLLTQAKERERELEEERRRKAEERERRKGERGRGGETPMEEEERERSAREGDIRFCQGVAVTPATWQDEIQVLKSKQRDALPAGSSKSHAFNPNTFLTPTYCRFCCQFIYGIHKQGVLCGDCGYPAHLRCSERVTGECGDVIRSPEEWSAEIKEIKERIKEEGGEEGEEGEEAGSERSEPVILQPPPPSLSRESFPLVVEVAHLFQKKTFHSPTYCAHCLGFIYGVHHQGVKCSVCNFPAHTPCAQQAPKTCGVARKASEWRKIIKEKKK